MRELSLGDEERFADRVLVAVDGDVGADEIVLIFSPIKKQINELSMSAPAWVEIPT